MKAFFDIKIGICTIKNFSVTKISHNGNNTILRIVDELSLTNTKYEISVDYDYTTKKIIKNGSKTTNELDVFFDEFKHVAEKYIEQINEIESILNRLSKIVGINDNMKILREKQTNIKVQIQTLSFHLLASDFYDVSLNFNLSDYIKLRDFSKALEHDGSFKLKM